MGSEWREASFSELCDITRGASPRPIHEWISTSGTPWVKISDATAAQSRFITKTGECIKNEARRSSVVVNAGDLIVSNSATPGIPKIMGIEACIHDGWLLLRNLRGLDKMFAYYLILRDRPALVEQGNGSVFTNLKTEILKKHRVRIPPLAEQKRIAGILGSLDDKIELNRKMNETLEQLANTLFKSWFVDFDPVHAKAAGRQPSGMDKATADLFPDSFVDSELGKIPKGWRAASIYEIAEVIYGAPFASGLFNTASAGRPLVRIRDLASEEPAVFTTEIHPKGYLLKPGDIAVGMDGEFRAYLWAGQESWLNQRVCVFAPKPGFSNAFVRSSIIKPLAEVEATETATTVIHLGKNDIDRFKVVVPETSVNVAFAKTCQGWYNQIVSNRKQSRSLSELRDTLLPRLLSGGN